MTEQTTPKRNSDFAKEVAQFADALAGYDHLPTFAAVQWIGQTVYVDVTSRHTDWSTELRERLAWATAFDAPARLLFNTSSHVGVLIKFEMAGFRIEMHETYYNDKAKALAEATEDVRDPNKTHHDMSLNEFAELIYRLAGSQAAREWQATYDRHFEASKRFNARDEEAAVYAERTTVEELGSRPGPASVPQHVLDEMNAVSDGPTSKEIAEEA